MFTAKTKQMAYANSDCDCSENEAWKNAWILKIINIKKSPIRAFFIFIDTLYRYLTNARSKASCAVWMNHTPPAVNKPLKKTNK
jgi:hypothetical protein